MAEGNYREYLKGERVRAKKYLYVIRPILACRWILERRTPPPMRFSELVRTQLEPELMPVVDRLLELKMSAPELGEVPRIATLNDFIERSLPALRERIGALPDAPHRGWELLNNAFLSALAWEESS